MVKAVISITFCLLLAGASLSSAETGNRLNFAQVLAPNSLTAEQVVMNSFKLREPADLSERPDDLRVLSSTFIQNLLFKTPKPAGSNLVIVGAIIKGNVDPVSFFSDSGSPKIVAAAVAFHNCLFTDMVSLRGVQFGKGLDLANSQFKGGLDLSDISVQGSIDLFGIELGGTKKQLSLASANISGDLLIDVPAALSIDATGLTSKTFSLTVPPAGIEEVLVAGASVTGSLTIESSNSGGPYSAGNTSSPNSFIRKKIDLSSATVGSLKISLPGCRKKGEKETLCWPVELFASGLTFHEIVVEKHADTPQESRNPFDLNLEFLNNANSSESAFTAYEQILRTSGQITEADRVYRDMHKKLRSDVWNSSKGFFMAAWAAIYDGLDVSQNVFLGYGRSAVQPLCWSVILIFAGTLFFKNQNQMEKSGDEKNLSFGPAFSSFWYSLELFLPVVDLGLAKKWRPGPSHPFMLAYWRAHQLAGWILIPVALAAITGALR